MEPAHADVLFEGLQDERLYSWIEEKRPKSIAWLRSRYEKLHARRSPDGSEVWLNWAVWSLLEQRYVGYVQATLRQDRAFIAYLLFVDSWGKGLAREAVAAMLNELTEAYHVSDVYALVDRRNVASVALLNSLNFEQVDSVPGSKLDLSSLDALYLRPG